MGQGLLSALVGGGSDRISNEVMELASWVGNTDINHSDIAINVSNLWDKRKIKLYIHSQLTA